MIIGLDRVRATDIPLAGGKGANLGELIAAGLPVPGGFCVTAEAYRTAMTPLREEIAGLLEAGCGSSSRPPRCPRGWPSGSVPPRESSTGRSRCVLRQPPRTSRTRPSRVSRKPTWG